MWEEERNGERKGSGERGKRLRAERCWRDGREKMGRERDRQREGDKQRERGRGRERETEKREKQGEMGKETEGKDEREKRRPLS